MIRECTRSTAGWALCRFPTQWGAALRPLSHPSLLGCTDTSALQSLWLTSFRVSPLVPQVAICSQAASYRLFLQCTHHRCALLPGHCAFLTALQPEACISCFNKGWYLPLGFHSGSFCVCGGVGVWGVGGGRPGHLTA